MVEYDRTQEREHVASTPLKICVVGVGGAGLNVLDRIALDRIIDATLVGMHTDVRVLSHAMTPHKIQLGAGSMRGIGSGSDPDLGRHAAEESAEAIQSLLHGHEMVFICAGLGGGTGSGAAPVVAQIAKECGALVFVFATTPFSFEGRRRLIQSDMALEELQRHADALILFENNRMGELVLPREGIQKAFSQADQLIGHSVRAIAAMVTQPGIVRLGLPDLITALRAPNARCLFGFGEARGANRVGEALKRALKSPLVNQGQLLQQAQNLIVHVAGGETLTLAEVEGLMKQLGKNVPDETQILFGISVDAKLGDSIALTLISSLSAELMTCEIKPSLSAPAAAAESAHVPVSRPKAAPAPVEEHEPADLPLLAHEPGHGEAEPAAEPAISKRQLATHATPAKPEEAEPVLAKAKPAPARKSPPPAPEEKIPAKQQEAPPLAKPSIFSVIEDEEEVEEEPEPAAAVVARPKSASRIEPKAAADPQPEEEEYQDEPDSAPEAETRAASPKGEPALAGASKAASLLQSTLNLHQEEIARFKGTDKTIVEGEDLDVPTWMRMRQKTRR